MKLDGLLRALYSWGLGIFKDGGYSLSGQSVSVFALTVIFPPFLAGISLTATCVFLLALCLCTSKKSLAPSFPYPPGRCLKTLRRCPFSPQIEQTQLSLLLVVLSVL